MTTIYTNERHDLLLFMFILLLPLLLRQMHSHDEWCRLAEKDLVLQINEAKRAVTGDEKKPHIPLEILQYRQRLRAWLRANSAILGPQEERLHLACLRPHWRDALIFTSKSKQQRYDSPLLAELPKEDGDVIIRSASQLPKMCFDPFDSKGIAAKMSKSRSSYGYGKSVEQIEEMFKQMRQDGTDMHADIHKFLNRIPVINRTKIKDA